MSKKPQYELCPRCELNYFIPDKNTQYCDVCMAELRLTDPSILIPDEDSEIEVICPVCKINFMAPDETMCFLCAKEQSDKLAQTEEPEDWLAEEEAVEPEEEPIEISLSELEEEELEDEEFDDNDNEPADLFGLDDEDDFDEDEDEGNDDDEDDDF